MGSCFSSTTDTQYPTTNIVSSTGELHRFETPVTAADVVLHLCQISSSSHSNNTSFLSHSDRITYDKKTPAMSPEEELVQYQIYFCLPNSSFDRRLSASDMAALAVKSGLALINTSKSSICLSSMKLGQIRRPVKNKISACLELESSTSSVSDYYNNYVTVKSGSIGLTRSGSIRKLKRYSSKRAKMEVRSFRLKLSTIHEGSVVQFF